MMRVARAYFVSLIFGAAMAQPAMYTIQPEPGSKFAFEVFKTGFMSGKKHLFVFERYNGTLRYDPAAPESSAVELTVEAASLVLKDEWLKPSDMKKVQDHAEKEMLDIEHHPQIRFTSTRVTQKGQNGFEAAGDLVIRGISKQVLVLVTLADEPGGKLRLSGKSQVRLKDYGLKPPSAVLGAVGTKNEMSLDFVVVAIPRPR
jgi:polyisoprenoid-binding protein YceI